MSNPEPMLRAGEGVLDLRSFAMSAAVLASVVAGIASAALGHVGWARGAMFVVAAFFGGRLIGRGVGAVLLPGDPAAVVVVRLGRGALPHTYRIGLAVALAVTALIALLARFALGIPLGSAAMIAAVAAFVALSAWATFAALA